MYLTDKTTYVKIAKEIRSSNSCVRGVMMDVLLIVVIVSFVVAVVGPMFVDW